MKSEKAIPVYEERNGKKYLVRYEWKEVESEIKPYWDNTMPPPTLKAPSFKSKW